CNITIYIFNKKMLLENANLSTRKLKVEVCFTYHFAFVPVNRSQCANNGTPSASAHSNNSQKSLWSKFFSRVRPHSIAPFNPRFFTERSNSFVASFGANMDNAANP